MGSTASIEVFERGKSEDWAPERVLWEIKPIKAVSGVATCKGRS
jgi:hypothetical protein